jgi:hypothetical protein
MGAGLGVGGAGGIRGTRVGVRGGGGTATRVWRVIELGWTVLKIRVIYLVIY